MGRKFFPPFSHTIITVIFLKKYYVKYELRYGGPTRASKIIIFEAANTHTYIYIYRQGFIGSTCINGNGICIFDMNIYIYIYDSIWSTVHGPIGPR